MIKVIEKPVLPNAIFGQKPEPKLIAQAVRVFLANQRQGTQNAKTRAEVARTRKKMYKQKGTGGARHGDRKAPVFVGGGIAFAPKPRDYSLDLPKKMKQKALFGALADSLKEKKLSVVSDVSSLTGKTSQLAKFLKEVNKNEVNCLLVTDKYNKNIWQAGRNIPFLTVLPLSQVNAYEVLRVKMILVMEEAFKSTKKA